MPATMVALRGAVKGGSARRGAAASPSSRARPADPPFRHPSSTPGSRLSVIPGSTRGSRLSVIPGSTRGSAFSSSRARPVDPAFPSSRARPADPPFRHPGLDPWIPPFRHPGLDPRIRLSVIPGSTRGSRLSVIPGSTRGSRLSVIRGLDPRIPTGTRPRPMGGRVPVGLAGSGPGDDGERSHALIASRRHPGRAARRNSSNNVFTRSGCSCCTQCPAPSIRCRPIMRVQARSAIAS